MDVALGVVGSTMSLFGLTLLTLLGVEAWIGATGTTGMTGVMFDELARDIGRDPGRVWGPSMTVLGMAGIVKPGGIVGVDRRPWSNN